MPRTLDFSELQRAGKLEAGRVVMDGGREALELESNGPGSVRVAVIDDPGIDAKTWSLRGEVRYEDVQAQSYLELLNTLGQDSVYFSRTLAERGPMQALGGSSGWRPFVLPFFSQADAPKPTRLTLSLVFTGKGKVLLRNVVLDQYEKGDPLAVGGGWWSERGAGVVGAILGSLLGLLGTLVGVLASQGRGRALAMSLVVGGVALGLALLAAGFAALFLGQPWYVYYPLLLAGAIATLVLGGQVRRVRRRYEELELQKMRAMDAG